MLQQFNIEIQKEQLTFLLSDLDEMYRGTKTNGNGMSLTLNRICKCTDMDVKVNFKMNFVIENDPPRCSSDNTEQYLLSIKIYASTDSSSLRQTQFARTEYEHVCHKKNIPTFENVADRKLEFIKLSEEIIQKYQMFKICTTCRQLFKDGRNGKEKIICPNCLYDRIFFLQDCQCVICGEYIESAVQSSSLICGHTFHPTCILTNFIKMDKRECPICRVHDLSP